MNLIPGAAATEELLVLEQAAYQTVLYLPLSDPMVEIESGKTIVEIINQTIEAIDNGVFEDPAKVAEYEKYIAELVDICEAHPELGQSVIGDLSWDTTMPGTDQVFPPDGMVAATFTNSSGQTSMGFRGTPSGAWLDNPLEMMNGPEAGYLVPYTTPGGETLWVTPMQHAALTYTEATLAVHEGELLILSGHSKGGNEAQLATIIFSDRVLYGYSFDGQGHSQAMVAQLVALGLANGGLDKLFGINADNDLVHALGYQLIQDGNVLYLQTGDTPALQLLLDHYILSILSGGNLTGPGAAGPYAETAKRFSDDLLSIEDPEVRMAFLLAIMAALQGLMGDKENGCRTVDGQDPETVLSENLEILATTYRAQILEFILNRGYRLLVLSGLFNYLGEDHLWEYFMIGEPAEDAAEAFLDEHDFETEQAIADYLAEHTETGKLDYLVRGALLRCRHGSHARRMNLLKCHGVYVGTHPVVHEANCVANLGPQADNITYYGVCRAPSPPPTDTVHYQNDVPRGPDGCPCGEAPGGIVSGHKCRPEIVQRWRHSYPKTRIVDNGDRDSADRLAAEQEDGEPRGYSSITTLSFLVCRYGGLIEPYNSGQEYDSDEEELAYAQENDLPESGEEDLMREVGGEGDVYGTGSAAPPEMMLNGKALSEAAAHMVEAMSPTSLDGRIRDYDWHTIGQMLGSDPAKMDSDQYDALSYVFGTMRTDKDLERFINLGYTASGAEVVDDLFFYTYYEPNENLTTITNQLLDGREQGTLSDEHSRHAEIMDTISEQGNRVYVDSGQQDPVLVKIDRDRNDYVVTISPETPRGATTTHSVYGAPPDGGGDAGHE